MHIVKSYKFYLEYFSLYCECIETQTKAPLYAIFSLASYLVPVPSKYLSQHTILEHPRPIFLPHCDRPTSAHRQNYISVYFYFFIFG
jgi:hypothetical protein